jgi:hypothetical protein
MIKLKIPSQAAFILIFLSFCIPSSLYALAPVESLVLGNFSDTYSENETDPLNYVYSSDQSIKSTKNTFKEFLANYRGFYEEGKNLTNFCKGGKEIRFETDWKKVQVMRSQMSLVQYIGLDLTTRAIPVYAKKLEFTSEEYTNLVEGLVGNYCSTNLSVISKKELLNNLKIKFNKENSFKLPSVEGNPFFPDNLDVYLPPKKAMENEFLYTVKLFQSLCSWSGNPDNAGLMVPILKHSGLMAFFQRQMSSQGIGFRLGENKTYLKYDENSLQVWCDNLICRKVSTSTFKEKYTPSLGSSGVHEDLKRLYCEEFRNLDYRPKESDPKLAKIMNSVSFDEENFINSQFIALITGVPDFLLRGETFHNGMDVFRSNIDYTWNKWAKKAIDNFKSDLFFEEPLTLELVDRVQYVKFYDKNLKVAFDVNLGEFDKINQRSGKIKVTFGINVPNSFLRYYRQAFMDVDLLNDSERVRLINRFKLHLVNDLKSAREKWILPPWKGDLEGLIANELTSQILERPESVLTFNNSGNHKIEVEINYGIFALKYINHQHNVKKNNQSQMKK